MPDRTLEENVSYLVDLVCANPGRYDLKGIFDVSQRDDLNWIGVGMAIGAAMKRNLIEARDERIGVSGTYIEKRNYYPVCKACPTHG